MPVHVVGLLLLILVTAIWGSTFAVVKILTEELSPSVLIAWRFLIATLALLPILSFQKIRSYKNTYPKTLSTPRLPLWRDGFILGAWLIAGYGTQTLALQTTSANRAAFFTALAVVLVPLWLTLVHRKPLTSALWVALPLAVCGLTLLCWEGSSLVAGDGWAALCAITYAGFILALERSAARHEVIRMTFVQLTFVTLFAWLWAFLDAPHQLWPSASAWHSLLYLGVAATALTTLCQTFGQRHVRAAQASLIYALEPAIATIFSFILLGERIGTKGILGGILVAGATILGQKKKSQSRHSQPHPKIPTTQ